MPWTNEQLPYYEDFPQSHDDLGYSDPEHSYNWDSYITGRRRLLGPAADITHPEFGRANRPEETFSVKYKIFPEQPVFPPDEIGREYKPKPGLVVIEVIKDYQGNALDSNLQPKQ